MPYRAHTRLRTRPFFQIEQQVEILVDDGTVDSSDDDDTEVVVVEAGVLGSVTTAASLYDTRLSAANGCDPAGCTAALTRVSRFGSGRIHIEAFRAG